MDLQSGREMSMNEKESIARHGFVFFYQRSCVHCKKMHPLVVRASDKSGVKVFLIDVDNNEEIRKFFNVKGWPALYHIVNKKIVADFNGNRNVEEIIQFLTN
jgi:thioredoxin-like negative regulator of GroEL